MVSEHSDRFPLSMLRRLRERAVDYFPCHFVDTWCGRLFTRKCQTAEPFITCLGAPIACRVSFSDADTSIVIHADDSYTVEDVCTEACRRRAVNLRAYAPIASSDGRCLRGSDAIDARGLRGIDGTDVTAITLILKDKCGGHKIEEGSIKRWTHDVHDWLLDYVVATVPPGMDRVRTLLSFIDKESSGGRYILKTIAKVQNLEQPDLKAEYYPNKDTEFFVTHREAPLRWMAIVGELQKLCPAESALSPETDLKALKKEADEDLLEFVRRFRRMASTTAIDKKKASHILLKKLPREVRKLLHGIEFTTVNMDFVERRVKYTLDWIRLLDEETYSLKELEEYFDDVAVNRISMERHGCRSAEIDGMDELCGVRDRIWKGSEIDFSQVVTNNTLMVAWKCLMQNSTQFTDEAEKFLKNLKQSRQSSGGSGGVSGARGTKKVLMIEDGNERMEIEEIDGIFSEADSTEEDECPIKCSHIQPRSKPSMHASVVLAGTAVNALIDTGATQNFIQKSLVDRLQLSHLVKHSDKKIVFANGAVETVAGAIDLAATLEEKPFQIQCFLIDGKGPAMIIGFRFLEQHGFNIDCKQKTLQHSDGLMVECQAAQLQKNDKCPGEI